VRGPFLQASLSMSFNAWIAGNSMQSQNHALDDRTFERNFLQFKDRARPEFTVQISTLMTRPEAPKVDRASEPWRNGSSGPFL